MAAIATPSFTRSRGRILIASADPLFRKRMLKSPLYAEAISEEAVGGAHALFKLGEILCDSVLLDRHLPDLDAGEVASLIRERYPRIEVEMVDSRQGPASFPVEWLDREEVATKCEVESGHAPEVVTLPLAETGPEVEALPGMIGVSRPIQQVYRLTRMVAPRDTAVLVTGETGTGKELVAHAVHEISARARQPFVVVNCAAIPEALLESELFGHARGAFTGAVQSRLGRIHVAHGGTLFLDEVGELPLNMQAKLLRFLQNGEVQRLGSADVYRVDVRVVAATNVRLLDLVNEKRFRIDLYYRLAVFPISIPPLRERAADLALLAEHFLKQLCGSAGVAPKRLAPSALELLREHAWPGNVRELQHAVERAFILAGAEPQLRDEHFQHLHENQS